LFDVYDSEIEGIGIIPFLWVKKWRFREIKWFTH
jgi:hypothetical protein